MQDYFKATTGNSFLGEWSPTLIMSIVGYLIPWLLSFVEPLESWDLASERLTADLLKNYYTSLLNIIFFIILKSQTNFDKGQVNSDKGVECKEDILVDEFLKLILAEIVLRYVAYLYSTLSVNCKACCGSDTDTRVEFELGDEIVWLFQI